MNYKLWGLTDLFYKAIFKFLKLANLLLKILSEMYMFEYSTEG